MDFNHNKLITNTACWELGMAMEDQTLHHDINQLIPSDQNIGIWPNYPLPTHQLSSISSTHGQIIPNSTLFDNQMEDQYQLDEDEDEEDDEKEELGAMKEMMYKIAAMQPVDIDPSTIRRPKRRNVRISDDPQSVAARLRRERISEKMRILQRLVPGGTKMDTASMLDEAICYVKFLKRQIRQLQSNPNPSSIGLFPAGQMITASEWPPLVPVPNIAINGSTTSSSSELPLAGHQYAAFGCTGDSDNSMCFNL